LTGKKFNGFSQGKGNVCGNRKTYLEPYTFVQRRETSRSLREEKTIHLNSCRENARRGGKIPVKREKAKMQVSARKGIGGVLTLRKRREQEKCVRHHDRGVHHQLARSETRTK